MLHKTYARLAIIATVALLSTEANALCVVPPPPEFDHAPQRSVSIIELPEAELTVVCQIHIPGTIVNACTWVYEGRIALRQGMDEALRTEVLRHEYGHINGWVHDESDFC